MDKYLIDLTQILDELEAEDSLHSLPLDNTTNNSLLVNVNMDDVHLSIDSSSSTSTSNVLAVASSENNIAQGEIVSLTSHEATSSKQKMSHRKNISPSPPPVKSSSHNLLSDKSTTVVDDNNLWSYGESPSLPSNSLKSPLHNESNEMEENNKQWLPCDEATVSVCDSYGDEELLRKVLEDVDEYEKYNLNSTDDLNFNLADSEMNVTGDDLEADLNAIINSVALSSSNFNHSSTLLPSPSSPSPLHSSSSSNNHAASDQQNTNAFSSQRLDTRRSSGNNNINNNNNGKDDHSATFSSSEDGHGPNGASFTDDGDDPFSPHELDCDPANDLTSPLKPCAVVRPNSLNLPTHESQENSQVSPESVLEESSVIERTNSNSLGTSPLVTVTTMDDQPRVGYVRPFWVPDRDALSCMRCDTKFSVIKRRHHCRACGKVLCNNCCNMRAKLAYLDFQEDRVCLICYNLLTTDDYYGENTPSTNGLQGAIASVASSSSANEQASGSSAAPLPPGVLKKPNQPPKQPKQVVFSDGIRPGGDLTEPEGSSNSSIPRKTLSRLRSPPVEVNSLPAKLNRGKHGKPLRTKITDSLGDLPPVLNCPALAAEPTSTNLISLLLTSNDPLTFGILKNLHVQVKITKLDCCCDIQVWNFTSKGLATVGQDEVSLILERVDGETAVPRAAFKLINSVYDSAFTGLVYSEMSHILFSDKMFDSKEYCGFLFIRPTSQCLKNLILPPNPFLIALLIQRSEVPWAKIFPLRLLLRLGFEFSTFPYPIVSFRTRKAAFFEVGHTIFKVLADFRNFAYNIAVLPGVVVRKNGPQYTLNLPKNRYDMIMKILNSKNNEHVLALGGNLDMTAEAHYACIQNEEGQYQSQVWSKNEQQEPEIIGASFIVFSGAFKSTTGLNAKASLVEDGVLVQVPANTLEQLKNHLKEMKDFTIGCGKIGQEPTETVQVTWTPDDLYFNVGVVSPIDGTSLQGVSSVRIHNSTDYANSKYTIRWTEVFFIENRDPGRRDATDPTKVAGIIGQIFCQAMTPHLDSLVELKINKIGLRVSIDPEQVGFEVGSEGKPLPPSYATELDGALIPVITSNILASIDALLVLELFFHILLK